MKDNLGLIGIFARHKVAANLLMVAMILAGVFALLRLNVQFLPSFNLEIVTVNIVWNGASAEDIENSIINPIEQEVRQVDHLKKMSSIAKTGSATIFVEFKQGSNMGSALEQVREKISQVRNLPADAEPAIITRVEPYESVARLLVYGPNNLEELRPLVHQFERELLDRGITKIEILGLPEQEIAIQVPISQLVALNMSLPQIAARVAARSQDLPAGTIGKAEVARQLRSLEQRRETKSFEQIPVVTNEQGQLIRLGDIATIEQRPQDSEVKLFYQNKPAVEMRLLRAENGNSLTSAGILHTWLDETRPSLGDSIKIKVYDETWQYIKERIDLLVKNGLGGLVLIILILFLFLNRRVAWWTVVGIPTSFMAAIAVLYFSGESINMLSLFGLIMSLGIIVDDTIVVGEQTLTNIHNGEAPLDAIVSAVRKMLAPVMSSSLTTISAFFPLFFVGGVVGTILFSIPLVVICVIVASLVECFMVLPGHLHHSFKHHRNEDETPLRVSVRERFEKFKLDRFKPIVIMALKHRATTLAIAAALFILSLGLVIGGHISFTFFPSPSGQILNVNVQFTVGTPPKKVASFMQQLNKTLMATNKELSRKGDNIVNVATTFLNYNRISNYKSDRGEQYASMDIELNSPDRRDVTNEQFVEAWQHKIKLPAGLENFSVSTRRTGPPGEDIDLQLTAKNPKQIKQASLELQNILRTYAGVSAIKDDLPFGQEQLVFQVNPTGRALNLTINNVGRQLRAAFNGQIVQIFHLPNEEIEVRVMLPDQQRYSLTTLEQFPIITDAGKNVPLGTVVKLRYRRGPDVLLHTDTKLSTHVTAKVDNHINNANKILAQLKQSVMPKLIKKHNIKVIYRGRAEEQEETFADMEFGLVVGLTLIYIILAWVFSSYGWPLVVMAVIPLGVTGAIFGHLLMQQDLTILSLFGLFGLSGIVINDSIILLSEYKLLRHQDWPIQEAIVEASCRRLRAVLLTSLTTIAGLLPLLFETSIQARFLIPMATSICFGLAYATLLILVVVPTLLSYYEEFNKHNT